MFIQTHPLDDAMLMRFVPGEPVLPIGSEPVDPADAANISPLARRLLKIDGVDAVSLALDDITICRAATSEWYLLKPAILGAIMEHYGFRRAGPCRRADRPDYRIAGRPYPPGG